MLLSLVHARVGARRLATGTILLLPLAACSGGDVLLPEDRTPAQLRMVSGDGQSAVAGSPVPNPLVVQVQDGAERPVEGAVIRFEFVDPPNGAAIAPSASETDSDGEASVEVTLGTPAGDQPVLARLDDPTRDLHVTFQLTAIRSNSGGGGGGDDDEDPPPDDGGGGGGGGNDGGDGGNDEDDGGNHGKGKGKDKGKNGNGGNNDNNGQGNGDD